MFGWCKYVRADYLCFGMGLYRLILIGKVNEDGIGYSCLLSKLGIQVFFLF